MVALKYLVVFILMIVSCTKCELNHSIHKRVSEINNKSRVMYGEVQKDCLKKDFGLEKFMYPRGNKEKLSVLSQAWRDYYTCSAAQLDEVNTAHIARNNVMIMVFQGATARLPCTLCHEPGKANAHTWLYARPESIGNFEAIQQYDRLTLDHGVMTIFNMVPGDEGVFSCKLGASSGGLVFVEVVDKEPYTVVKPPDSRGPHAVATEIYQGVILFTKWTPWTECSVCGKVGRRHRNGICYVKLEDDLIASYVVDSVKAANRYKLFELDEKLIELFLLFPGGVPCRSQYLPQTMRDLDVIQQRSSEIMIGMCKVPCEDTRRKRNKANHIVENGTLLYSIKQILPKQPPLPVRDTIFADFGQRVVIRCPGTTLRDVPVQWRVGTKDLVPRDVDQASGGRVHLNCRDHLVFTAILYSDDNLYSCWQRDNLAGTVKLVVSRGSALCGLQARLSLLFYLYHTFIY